MSAHDNMTIGALAAETECTVPTIRYYEEIGLLPAPERRSGGHRVYGEADVLRLTFVRRCRDFGFPIEQVREMVALLGSSERDCTAARDLAATQLVAVRKKQKELRALERSLKSFVDDCSEHCAGGPAGSCVILDELKTAPSGPCCNSPRGSNNNCCADEVKDRPGYIPAVGA